MIKEFKIQLAKARPLTQEEIEQLELTNFHIENDPVKVNLKYKLYFSGREKKVGDIVLVAVLATLKLNQKGREDIELKTITIHPEEVENFELFKIQPTFNDTLFPVVTYKEKKKAPEAPTEIKDLLEKIIYQGFNSLTKEEVELLNKNSNN